ncbi:MAG: hypothetical protein B7Y59_12635 [Burkholderiales bacterium 35-55-47]|jgi:acetyltransferase EpsM|nr:MAG: hypothetical protein B7Y59_12635 [Burkholderiales bacterium 35-55-47]OZA98922.1 MAG: hypothetical protein B7X62_12620 [Burkholderiales bacterium 39-55-53]
MKKIVILGGPGDGVVIAASLAFQNNNSDTHWELVGFLNDAIEKGSFINGVAVLGKLEDWRTLPDDTYFISALHKVRQMKVRASRVQSLGIPLQRWGSVIDSTARVSKNCLTGVGSYLGPNVIVQPGAKIGNHVSIRGGANIGHDVVIEDYCYIGPNSTLCGRSSMLKASHLGPNSCLADGVRLGLHSVVGIGSAVTKHVPDNHIVFGVPASRILAPLGDFNRKLTANKK